MAVLSSGPIWVLILERVAPELAEQITTGTNLTDVTVTTDGTTITATGHLDDPTEASWTAWQAARWLSAAWGIVPPDVPSVITINGRQWTSSGATMLGVRDGADSEWWTERTAETG